MSIWNTRHNYMFTPPFSSGVIEGLTKLFFDFADGLLLHVIRPSCQH